MKAWLSMPKISLDQLTNRELGLIEEATGKLIEDLVINGRMSHTFKCAVAWVGLLRTDPSKAFEEVLEAGIEFFDDVFEDDDPKE